MKSCPIAVTPRLPSHPIAMPSMPSPPNSFEMSEKSTAYVSSSDAHPDALPSSHGFSALAKSHRPSQPDTFSSARFASDRELSARSVRAMSVTSVLFPVITAPNMCVNARHIGMPTRPKTPRRKSSLMHSSCFFSILSATAFPLSFGLALPV